MSRYVISAVRTVTVRESEGPVTVETRTTVSEVVGTRSSRDRAMGVAIRLADEASLALSGPGHGSFVVTTVATGTPVGRATWARAGGWTNLDGTPGSWPSVSVYRS